MTQTHTTPARATIITVTSGKGGVGKTNVVINLAIALARLGHRVGVLDADFGLGNIDVLLGLTPPFHLGHLLNGERTLEEIIIEGPLGIRIIPAGSGIRSLTALNADQWNEVAVVIRRIGADLDYLFLDTAAGVSDNVVELMRLAERVIVVTSFEPAAVVDAYAVVKILTATAPDKEIGLIVNAARDGDEASLVFRQLDVASTRFLNRSLRFYGFVVDDDAVREAVLGQRPIVDHLPQAPASRCFRIVASRLAGLTSGGGGRPAGPPIVAPSVTTRPDEGAEETMRCA
jgi:flagellar biosynthesis protein FlhG